jgi:hypothetical protein
MNMARVDEKTSVQFVSSFMGEADYRVYPRDEENFLLRVRIAPVSDYERSIRNPHAEPARERPVGEYWSSRTVPSSVVEWIEKQTGLKLTPERRTG